MPSRAESGVLPGKIVSRQRWLEMLLLNFPAQANYLALIWTGTKIGHLGPDFRGNPRSLQA